MFFSECEELFYTKILTVKRDYFLASILWVIIIWFM